MTNLLKAHKETFACLMANETFNDLIEEAKAAVVNSGVADQIYRAAITEEQEAAMNKVPEWLLDRRDYLPFTTGYIRDSGTIKYEVKMSEAKPGVGFLLMELSRGRALSLSPDAPMHPSDKVPTDVVKKVTALIRKVRKLSGEVEKLRKEKEGFEEQVKTQLSNIRTLSALKKRWPEVYDDFVRLTNISTTGTALTLPVANLNNLIDAAKRRKDSDNSAKQEKAA